jgi:hypothetical protein
MTKNGAALNSNASSAIVFEFNHSSDTFLIHEKAEEAALNKE